MSLGVTGCIYQPVNFGSRLESSSHVSNVVLSVDVHGRPSRSFVPLRPTGHVMSSEWSRRWGHGREGVLVARWGVEMVGVRRWWQDRGWGMEVMGEVRMEAEGSTVVGEINTWGIYVLGQI